jgi:hypothetical protein
VSSKSKRQQTAAKRTREQAVRERRELKQQKRQAAAAERRARAAGIELSPDQDSSEHDTDDRAEDGESN